MKDRIVFNTNGYDPFIDVIKAYAIVCVLIGHFLTSSNTILGPIWLNNQVPLFLAVSCFHFLKKEAPKLRIEHIFSRVIVPFVVIQFFIVLILTIWSGGHFYEIVYYFYEHGGYGQGDYFPIVYFQIALLLPLFHIAIRNIKHEGILLFSFIVLCEILEIICSVIDIPDSIYRILAIRYIFLVYCGWKWAKHGVSMNPLTWVFSIISLLSIVYFGWFSIDDEPWFYSTVWKYHRWPCYFFVTELGIYILYNIWMPLSKSHIINKSIAFLASRSYEIFLAQMLAYVLFPMSLFSFLPSFLILFAWFICAFVFSLIFGELYHRFLSFIFKSKTFIVK